MCLLDFFVSILYPRCPFHKWSYQIFSAGLLQKKQLLVQVSDKNLLLSRYWLLWGHLLHLEETVVIDTNGSIVTAQQTLNMKQLAYELEWSYLLWRRNAQWDRILIFLRKQYITVFISPPFCVSPQSAVLLKAVLLNPEIGNP